MEDRFSITPQRSAGGSSEHVRWEEYLITITEINIALGVIRHRLTDLDNKVRQVEQAGGDQLGDVRETLNRCRFEVKELDRRLKAISEELHVGHHHHDKDDEKDDSKLGTAVKLITTLDRTERNPIYLVLLACAVLIVIAVLTVILLNGGDIIDALRDSTRLDQQIQLVKEQIRLATIRRDATTADSLRTVLQGLETIRD